MARATFTFPQGFLWGTATASHQIEGNNTNNQWWAWEQEEGRILNGDKSGRACDWWAGRWREDFDRAHESYQNAHRFSVEWARIQPEEERWDEAALDKYRDMLLGLKERRMTAMVTLFHFSIPNWLAEKGGWENPETITLFGNYVQRTVEALKAHCELWVTINEPNVYATNGYISGLFPPGKKDIKVGLQVLVNMLRGHALAYRLIHELQAEAKVGLAHHWHGFIAADKNPLTRYTMGIQDQAFNESLPQALLTGKFDAKLYKIDVPEAAGTQDYFGLNYYTRELVRFNLFKPSELYSERFFAQDAELSETGFLANDPAGFTQAIRWARQFDLPIYITENGCDDSKDDFRRKYLLEHLLAVWHQINHNIPIKGYFHWSLTDNFEWERGWTQRFGLWGLDPTTQLRTRRKSVDLYAEICRTNSISSEAVEKWAPEVYERIFPG